MVRHFLNRNTDGLACRPLRPRDLTKKVTAWTGLVTCQRCKQTRSFKQAQDEARYGFKRTSQEAKDARGVK